MKNKFRIWDNQTRKMIYDIYDLSNYLNQERYVVMQCIGKINDTFVYEDDVIQYKWKYKNGNITHVYERKYIVKYDYEMFVFYLYNEFENEAECIYLPNIHECLGNIHENYELVEEMRNESYA